MMTPEQCRAARAWLDMRQEELAKLSNVGLSTLRDFEGAKRKPIGNNVAAIRAALEARGIEFIEDEARRGVAAPRSCPSRWCRTAGPREGPRVIRRPRLGA